MSHDNGGHEVRAFVHRWFAMLNRRVPVHQILRHVSPRTLEMVFPEATLRCHDDVRRWYDEVGQLYRDQSHTVEHLSCWAPPTAEGPVAVGLTVVWCGANTHDGSTFAFRVNQRWILTRHPAGDWQIRHYEVTDITALD